MSEFVFLRNFVHDLIPDTHRVHSKLDYFLFVQNPQALRHY